MRSAQEFLLELAEYYGAKNRQAVQDRIESEELSGLFLPDQFEPLFRAVIRTPGRFMPKLGDILIIAAEGGIARIARKKGTYSDEWTTTDCPLCQGEGLLQVIMRHSYERKARENIRRRSFVDLGRYSDKRWIGKVFEDGDTSYVFRCACRVGDDYPSRWPKWDAMRHRSGDSQALHRPAEDTPDPQSFRFEQVEENPDWLWGDAK